MFSIIIANYNFARFLSDAIQSVISQDVGDLVELIICDAASSDNSVEIIKKYANGLPPNTSLQDWVRQSSDCQVPQPSNQLITWWCSEPDGGQSTAFNKGFAHARGRFLTWLNADDILTAGALKSIARAIQRHPRCEWFIGSSVWTDAQLHIRRCFCAHRFSVLRARYGTLSVGGPSSFFTKRLLDAAGGFDEGLHYKMDTDLWYRFFLNCAACYCRVRHNIFAYRQHEASKMSGADQHVTERALENRRRANFETIVLSSRYGTRTGWRSKLIQLATVSPLDHLVVAWRNLCWRGRCANEI